MAKPISKLNSNKKKNQQQTTQRTQQAQQTQQTQQTTQALSQNRATRGKTADEYRQMREERITRVTTPKPVERQQQRSIKAINVDRVQRARQAANSTEDDRLMQLAREQAQALYNRTSDDRFRSETDRQNITDLQDEYQSTLRTLHEKYGYDTSSLQQSLNSMRQVNRTKNDLSANARSIVEQSGIQTRGIGDQDAYDTVIRYFGYGSKY